MSTSRDPTPGPPPQTQVAGPCGSDGERTQSLVGVGATGPEPDPAVILPRQIGRYFPLAWLGAGGMGVVYAAYDPDLDRQVALKLVRPDRAQALASTRLLREAQAQARLSHPNVVQIYDFGIIGEQVFLAMEFVRGVDLRAWLAHSPRSLAEKLEVFAAAGQGLAAAHDAGLVHRDFKPENVLIGTDARVRVSDFGLAREQRSATPSPPMTRRESHALALTLTAAGDLLGTPAYMSPEQHLGLPVDPRSDQFSFCVALWEALYGHKPFTGATAGALATAAISGALVAPPAGSRVPRGVEAALRRGLAVQPERRFKDIRALLAELVREPPRRRRQHLLAIGLLTVGAGAGLMLAPGGAEAPCSGSEAAIAATWNPERRAAVAAALPDPTDHELATRVLASFDAFAASWIREHRDACLDHQRGEHSSALLDARVRCLEHRREAMDGAVTAVSAEGSALDAAQIVARLPAPAVCAEAEIVLAEPPPPADRELALAIAATRARLAAARTHEHGGDLSGALALADAALIAARRLDHGSLLAEVLLTRGTLRMNHGDMPRARADLGEALAGAIAARRDDLAAEAHARKLYIDGVPNGHSEAALEAAPLALALAGRAPEPHVALGLAYNNIGAIHDARGDRAAAAAASARALVEMAAAPQQDPIEFGNAMVNAAMFTDEAGERRALVRRAVGLFTTYLGPTHRMTLDRQTLRAQYEPDPRDGMAVLAETCPHYLRLDRAAPVYCGECWYDLGQFTLLLGEPARASAAFERALQCPPGADEDPLEPLRRELVAAFIAVAAKDGPAALVAADAAIRRLTQAPALVWTEHELAQAELLRGQALLLLARPVEAADALARALALLAREVPRRPAMLPRIWLARAQQDLAAALRLLPTPQLERADALARSGAAGLADVGLVVGPPSTP